MIQTDEIIQSPCIRNCCLNEDDVCVGCFRTLAEVVAWSGLDNENRQATLDKAALRRAAYRELSMPVAK